MRFWRYIWQARFHAGIAFLLLASRDGPRSAWAIYILSTRSLPATQATAAFRQGLATLQTDAKETPDDWKVDHWMETES